MKNKTSITKPGLGSKSGSRLPILLAFAGVVLIAGVISFIGYFFSVQNVEAQALRDRSKYKATRPIVVDPNTGERRMPSNKEINDLVDSLQVLTKRPAGGLKSASLQNDATAIDLDGGFNGVMLARPTAAGTFETRCVFTFEEGIEFMGLVEDKS